MDGLREIINCPELVDATLCSQPAVITDRFVLESTDGPIEHMSTSCEKGHILRFPSSMLDRTLPITNEDNPKERSEV